MNLPKLPLLAAVTLLVACGEKEAPAPAPKAQNESSVDALLEGGNAATRPAPAAPTGSAPAPTKPAPARSSEAGTGVVNPMQPGNPAYDRYTTWLQKLHSGTPAEKQATRSEIARAGLSPKEREEFEKLKAHFGVKD